jgi:hypothetical protein
MPDTNPPPDDPAQSQRFIDMAREVGAEDGEAFDRVLKKVTESPPIPFVTKRKPSKV